METSLLPMAESNPVVMLTQGQLRQLIRQEIQSAMNCTVSFHNNQNKGIGGNTLADRPYLSVQEAAKLSGLGVSTVRLHIRRGKLKPRKVGRRIIISRAELEHFLGAAPA
jgi:excisionase family DNA binding protein